MQLALITINYNQSEITNEFLYALGKNEHIDKTLVIVVDVSDTKEKTTISSELPHQIIIRDVNGGYSHGVNIGLREALSRGISRFCVINNDTLMHKNFINTVLSAFTRHEAFGGKIYYAKGFEYHLSRYKKTDLGHVLWYAGGYVDWNHATTHHRGVDEVDSGQYDTEQQTDFVTGCLFCFNKKVLDKIKMWNEKYFLYYEDADYSERIKRAGFPLYYVPEVELWHKNAQSTQGAGSSLHQKHQRAGRVRFALTFAPLRTKLHILKNYLLGR